MTDLAETGCRRLAALYAGQQEVAHHPTTIPEESNIR
jgi:hypothetical protein